jgi:hypothetical protein
MLMRLIEVGLILVAVAIVAAMLLVGGQSEEGRRR